MKKIINLMLLLFMLFGIQGMSYAQEKLVRYGVKSGIVEYIKTIEGKVLISKISGSGTQGLYFKDFGAIEVQRENSSETSTTKLFGSKNEETTIINSFSKLDNGLVTHVDMETGLKSERRDIAMDLMRQPGQNAYYTGEQLLIDMGGEKIGTKEFLGYKCDIWDIPGGEQLIYKGVVLKADIKILGIRTVQEATSAKFDIIVPEKYFVVPSVK